jgi:acyl-CoA thioesterase II
VKIRDVSLVDLLTLEPHGPDTFVGVAAQYPWNDRLYGGQVIAQALSAASATVGGGRLAHSLHAYFIRPGTHTEPVRFEVERLRDGRSFSTRQVVARQSSGAILNLSASFHTHEDEADVPVGPMPSGVPLPDDPSLLNQGWGRLLDRKAPPGAEPVGCWVRLLADLGADPVLQQCALAFMSDAAPSRPARQRHPEACGDDRDRGRFQGASLDHAMWFHRPSDVADWHWFAMRSHGLAGARGVVSGDVFDAAGRHIATVAQQVLLRRDHRVG